MSYYLFISVRLNALEKQPGFCPVRVGETWRHIFSKCVLRVTVPVSNSVFQYVRIYEGLKAAIDVSVHGVSASCDTKSATENWGFLLVYAKKRFQ